MRTLLVLVLSSGVPTQPEGPSPRVAREQERVARLELEAARSKKLYLMVDLGSSTASLRLSGVTLASYPFRSVEVGMPMTKREVSGAEELVELYRCQSLAEEELREIVPGAPPAPVEATEEVEPGASRVVLVCEPSLALVFSSNAAFGLRDRLRLPSDGTADRRVRVVLEDAEARRLFASLPRELLVLFSRIPKETG